MLITGLFCIGVPIYPESYLPVFPLVGEERVDGFLLGPNILEQHLKLCCASESPRDLIKMQILIQWVSDEAQGSAFQQNPRWCQCCWWQSRDYDLHGRSPWSLIPTPRGLIVDAGPGQICGHQTKSDPSVTLGSGQINVTHDTSLFWACFPIKIKIMKQLIGHLMGTKLELVFSHSWSHLILTVNLWKDVTLILRMWRG